MASGHSSIRLSRDRYVPTSSSTILSDVKYVRRTIRYRIERDSSTEHMRLVLGPRGGFVLTVPTVYTPSSIEHFMRSKIAWIRRHIAPRSRHATKRSKRSVKQYREHAVAARALVLSRLEHFNQVYGYSYGQVRIRDQRTRWGSCSKKGNLNFNHRIVLLPEALVDYVIVHELCHLKEFNHSKDFWALVARTIPDYQKRRHELRTHETR